MIYILTALYLEAKPIIERYNLKKEETILKFQVFSNEKLKLIISGTGKIKASIALSQLLTNAIIKESDFLINLGFCASINKEDSLLDVVMINKISNAYSKQSFYPEMLYKHSFLEGSLICFDKIQSTYHCDENSNKEIYIDMESIGFFETANYFFRKDKIIVLKIISDILFDKPSHRKVAEINEIEKLSKAYTEIFRFIENLFDFCLESESSFSIKEEIFIKKIRQNLKLSDTMYYEFMNLLKYLKLSEKNIFEFLKDYENIEINNKLEGKKKFEDIKKRIIDQ
ncbi:hypothetical protein [Fusobacterium russii]|uniref:hypothetical protein n=1 Tax=Fusobacterium russii TaxID=854 RepID=UPI00039D287D|nr:hypothetical protein [Fusobacterium russii]